MRLVKWMFVFTIALYLLLHIYWAAWNVGVSNGERFIEERIRYARVEAYEKGLKDGWNRCVDEAQVMEFIIGRR